MSAAWAAPVLAQNTAATTPLRTFSPTPTLTATPTPTDTPFPTATPYPCSFPYGVTITGADQPSKGWAYESPVTLSLPAKVDKIHTYASQAATLVAGLYDGSNNLVESVTLQAPGEGWQAADFPATLKAGPYYLAEAGMGVSVNLAVAAGVSCYYDPKGILGKSFQPSGSLPAALPVYLTGSAPKVIQGMMGGFGDSIMSGDGRTGGGFAYWTLTHHWLNDHYGPMGEWHFGPPGLDTKGLREQVGQLLGKQKPMNICILHIGMKDLESTGGPDSSNCGGASMVSGISSALRFRDDLQNILSAIRKHMAPGGTIILINLYEADDYFLAVHPGWKDYPALLKVYNGILADVAWANGARLVDAYTVMASNPAFRDSLNLHPNSAGHAAIAVLIEKAAAEGPLAPGGKAPGGR